MHMQGNQLNGLNRNMAITVIQTKQVHYCVHACGPVLENLTPIDLLWISVAAKTRPKN